MNLQQTIRVVIRITKQRPDLSEPTLVFDPKNLTYKAIEFLNTRSGDLVRIPCETKTQAEA